ncbi:MAG TPA: YebC/PmpR family DNA-binding transcriptional regulator [Spirochaetota bacterium]|nr:YebC/PmpR family DNA-binding transcriptional regulator [Spirochaetota bacterium]HRZ27564.1 YebC/PmpR family DNA-binding transcriptional regulator [Spirochaetota bacterium]HSA14340.1 YebC/PmpR family DNA-binding transcriptional regulator [Spirochaetota bacterium]
MSGHSKWATIKRKKGALDAKRGALFTKIIKEITIAARMGGEDPNANPRLRTAVAKAKANNMPNDNIDRAIKKGAGTLDGVIYEEIRYEGYGPGGVAIMVDCLTDNRNRTTPEVRTTFSKHGGNLGEAGCVAYMFSRKGNIIIEPGQTNEDEVMELLLDYDVDDITTDDGIIEIVCSADSFNEINDLLTGKGFKLSTSEITMIPQTTVPLDEKKAAQCMRLVELLEDLDDAQNVYSNYDISDEIMMKISEGQ